ncbi:hypothetical protein ACOSQ2_003083 [Xanthoceras sorbifolium]
MDSSSTSAQAPASAPAIGVMYSGVNPSSPALTKKQREISLQCVCAMWKRNLLSIKVCFYCSSHYQWKIEKQRDEIFSLDLHLFSLLFLGFVISH